ncbi:Transcription initiation factor TFIID subunit [Hirschfeldia incana]|nr:Transcription initiation factor TFIID subunit [Hirschfeldia incana]
MALLGDDGRGFDLARRLESSGVWRTWLGDSIYLSFNHCLSSPSSWEAFMRVDESKSRAQIQLQLRVRALLYDKATVSLFLRSHSISGASSSDVSKLNHNYLQLHGDDVYYTLENASPESGFQRDGGLRHNQSIPKSLSKPSFNSGRRGSESDFSNLASQRSRFEELPDTWYTQFISRCGFKYGMSVGGQESDKRTPEGMSTYLRAVDTHKRKRAPFIEDRSTGSSGHMGRSNMHPSSGFDGSSSDDDILFPETIFRMNCVPETALSPIVRTQDDDVRTEFYGVLDTLPQVNRSHVMIERLGMMPEYLRMEDRGVLRRKKAEKMGFSDEQATQVSRKVVARMLLTMGFEGATEVPVDVFSQLVSRHISKLGRILKVLTDSYKKECSAVQLIKMFLNTTGYNNLGGLAELVKDGTRMIHHPQNQKQPQVLQQQLHMQQQAHSRLPQQLQIQRQMHPQMQQMVNPQSLQQQQLLERMRKRQVTSPRPNMDMEKDRPLVQVKLENPSEMAVDGNAFNPMNPRHQQQIHQQFRQQQQIAALSNMQQQQQQQPGYNQFRQLASMQIPQMQTPTTGTVRAQPVKVEGFEQLMGGDSSLKHETEDKLRSPPTK